MNKSVWLLMVNDVQQELYCNGVCIGVFESAEAARIVADSVDSNLHGAWVEMVCCFDGLSGNGLKCYLVDDWGNAWLSGARSEKCAGNGIRVSYVWAPDAESAVERARELAKGEK